MTDDRLQPLPEEEFRRVLCVAAHPDDNEYGTSAAVARWGDQGTEVTYLLLTSGEAGMQRPPSEVGPLRKAEQQRACEAVGVSELIVLDFPDGVLEYSLELRRAIARVVRRVRPDAVVTMSWDIEVGWGLNQADHRVAGLATLDAVRDADNTWVFPDLARDEGLEKWHTGWLLVSGDARPTHYVDVTGEPLQRGIASLAAHEAYLADLPWHPSPGEMLSEATSGAGRAAGVSNAVVFRAHRL